MESARAATPPRCSTSSRRCSTLSAIAKDSVVSLAIELYDGAGALIQSTEDPLTYLHGGYGGLLAALERQGTSEQVAPRRAMPAL